MPLDSFSIRIREIDNVFKCLFMVLIIFVIFKAIITTISIYFPNI